MLIAFLLLAFVTLWIVCFVVFERDMVSPAMLVISGYTICVGVAFLMGFSHPYTYHAETVFVLLVGTVLFLIPSYGFKRVFENSEVKVKPEVCKTLIVISPWALLLHALLIVALIFSVLLVHQHILKPWYPNLSLTQVIPTYRMFTIWHPEITGLTEVLVINQIKKIFIVTVYFLLFVAVRNAVICKSFLADKMILLNLFLAIVMFGSEGGRGGIVAYFFAGLALWFFFDRYYNGAWLAISLKLLGKLAGGGTALALFFFALLWSIGRKSGGFDVSDLIAHVEIYLGAPIPLLDNFLQTSMIGLTNATSEIFGKETFFAFNSQLAKLHVLSIPLYSPHLEFRPGVFAGNCYTAYRSYMYDFGYLGLVLCPILFSAMANAFYYTCVRLAKTKVISCLVILYSTVIYTLFIDFERSCFFTYWLGLAVVINLVGYTLLAWLLIKLRWMKFKPYEVLA